MLGERRDLRDGLPGEVWQIKWRTKVQRPSFSFLPAPCPPACRPLPVWSFLAPPPPSSSPSSSSRSLSLSLSPLLQLSSPVPDLGGPRKMVLCDVTVTTSGVPVWTMEGQQATVIFPDQYNALILFHVFYSDQHNKLILFCIKRRFSMIHTPDKGSQ